MARPWRIEYEGAYYHVFSRGNEGKVIFYGDEDKKLLLETLGEMPGRFEEETGGPGKLLCHRFGAILWMEFPNLCRSSWPNCPLCHCAGGLKTFYFVRDSTTMNVDPLL